MDNFHLVVVLKTAPEPVVSVIAAESKKDKPEIIATKTESTESSAVRIDFSGSDPRTVLLFWNKRSVQLKQESPWMSPSDIAKKVCSDWHAMDNAARREYITNGPEALKTKNYVTSPVLEAAYLCFWNERYPKLKQESSSMSHFEIDQAIYDEWHKTDFFTRQKYIQKKPEEDKSCVKRDSAYQAAISNQTAIMDKYASAKEEALHRGTNPTIVSARKRDVVVQKPLSSYLYYSAERRQQLKDMDPDMPFGDVTSAIHFEWRAMDAEARQKYTDLSAKDKARYQNEKAAYKGKTMAKKEKDPNAPKRPLSAYLYYASERRPNLKKEDPTLSFIDATKQIALEWKIMTPVAREKWTKLAAADNDRYTHEKAAYLVNKTTQTPQTTKISQITKTILI